MNELLTTPEIVVTADMLIVTMVTSVVLTLWPVLMAEKVGHVR